MQNRGEPTVLLGRDDDAVAVGGIAEPAERHREPSLGFTVAPLRCLAPDRRDVVAAEIAHPSNLRAVAGPLGAGDHLPDVAHSPALEAELLNRHDRLVAELQRPKTCVPDPALATELAAADDGRNPGMPAGFLEKC